MIEKCSAKIIAWIFLGIFTILIITLGILTNDRSLNQLIVKDFLALFGFLWMVNIFVLGIVYQTKKPVVIYPKMQIIMQLPEEKIVPV